MNDYFRVTEQDRAFYREHGYWIGPKLFDHERIERLRKAHDRIWAKDYDGDGFPLAYGKPTGDPYELRKIDNAWWINDEVREAVTDPQLGRIASELIGADGVRLWYDQVICKPGFGGQPPTSAGNAGWHQDYVYWQCTDTTNLVTAWIALQDTDLSNGCMLVVPGSHQWGLLSSAGFFDPDLEKLKRKFAENRREWKEVPTVLRAGQASFHHALTFHASGPNTSSAPRLSIVAHLMPHDTAYKNQGEKVDNIRLLGPKPKEGQRFDNEFFPLLYKKPGRK